VQTLTEIKAMLEARGLSPRKALGQNFLIDHNLIRKLVDSAAVGPGDRVLEIGPGTGTLTEELLRRGCRVIACELDRELAGLLRDGFQPVGAPKSQRSSIANEPTPPPSRPLGEGSSFVLIEGDCLESKREISRDVARALSNHPFTLVANLPYNAATPLMLTLLCEHPECRGLFVTIQREVADRLLAKPGTKDFGPLAIVAQAVGEVRLIATLPPECFWPRPDVTSAMVSVTRRAVPLTAAPRALADFCQNLFSQRRKQLGSVLGRTGSWPEKISPTLRAEQLTVEQIIELQRARAQSPPTDSPDRVA